MNVILERKFEECSKECLVFRQEWEEAEKLSGASIACAHLALPALPLAGIIIVSGEGEEDFPSPFVWEFLAQLTYKSW